MLYNLFTKHGTVVRHYIVRNRGISRGYGFVCFKHPEEAARALHRTNRIVLYKKTIYVSLAQDQQERTASLQNIFASRAVAARRKLREGLLRKFLLPVDMKPGVLPIEEISSVTVNIERFGEDNIISTELATSLRCLVIGIQDPKYLNIFSQDQGCHYAIDWLP